MSHIFKRVLFAAVVTALLPLSAHASVLYDLTLTPESIPGFGSQGGSGQMTLTTGIDSTASSVIIPLGPGSDVTSLTFSIGGNSYSFTIPSTPAEVQFQNGTLFGIGPVSETVDGATFSISGGDTYTYFAGGVETIGTVSAVIAAVPEASTWAMMLLGFAGVAFITFRRKANLTRLEAV